jgi:hypothetical protein
MRLASLHKHRLLCSRCSGGVKVLIEHTKLRAVVILFTETAAHIEPAEQQPVVRYV